MQEQAKLSFEFAASASKQLISLAMAILVVSVAFVRDVMGGLDSYLLKYLVGGAWVLYFFSIVTGVATLLALTGSLQPKETDTPQPKNCQQARDPSIWKSSVIIFSILNCTSFLIATLLVVVFGVVGLFWSGAVMSKAVS